ncbi:MAG: tetratricopeptide repeat protein, partial [Ignavibacteriae bacterium]|nr:tetratricopeptide repeat protein [Ignavibacteriota bacterium]
MMNYRYSIVKKIGQGGSGEVFLVQDMLHEERVAMKVFFSARGKTVNIDEIRKEFYLLKNLSHPHLIRVFDVGTVVHSEEQELLGRHFYTMEYLEGKDSLSYFAQQPLNPHKVELMEIAFIQLLSVLAYIHHEGIIHFDIKPQNLIIIEGKDKTDIIVKLTDFGFCTTTFETIDIPVRGTLDYTAPELLKGFPIDHRIDLYSLGATFYHLWTNRCPFEASTPLDLIKIILTEESPSLDHDKTVMTILPDIIENLLQKDPDRRYQNALQAMIQFATPKYEDLVKNYLGYSQKPKFVGREKEKERVEDIIEQVICGNGKLSDSESRRIISVVGPFGIGKSEFINQVVTDTHTKGILTIDCRLSNGQSSGEQFVTMLHRLCIELQLRNYSASEFFSKRIVSLLKNRGAKGSLDTFINCKNDCDRIAEAMVKISTMIPFVLILDNQPEIDLCESRILNSLTKNIDESKIVIITEENEDSGKLLFNSQTELRLSLPELTFEETATLVHSSLDGAFASNEIIQKMHRLFGGIPYPLVEALRSIHNAFPLGFLSESTTVTGSMEHIEEFLSVTFEDFFARWYRKMNREKQLLLELLSCFDRPPRSELLRKIVPFKTHRLVTYLDSLESEGLGHSIDNGKRYEVRHATLKKYLYKHIEKPHELHTFIASMLDDIPDVHDLADLEEAGRQYFLAGNVNKASQYYEAAGDQAVQLQRFDDAVVLYKKAISNTASVVASQREMSIMTKLADAYFANGTYQESIELYQEILSNMESDDVNRVGTLTKLGKAFSRLGDYAEAHNCFRESLALTTDDGEHFEIQQEIIGLMIAEGYFDEAITLSQNQRAYAEQHSNKDLLAAVQTSVGIAEFYRGNYQASLKLFTFSYEIYKEHNKQKSVDALMNIGNVLSELKDQRSAL